MWKTLVFVLLLSGCADLQLPPSPADIEAKKFQNLPDKAVIYVVRTPMDSEQSAGISLDYQITTTTNPGTYYRFEVAPGKHRIADYGGGAEQLTLNVEAGKIYFIQHTVLGFWRSGPQITRLQQISDASGRALVTRSMLIR